MIWLWRLDNAIAHAAAAVLAAGRAGRSRYRAIRAEQRADRQETRP